MSDAVYRRRGRDCWLYYRRDGDGWIERAVYDAGEVGDVYEAGLDPTTADAERLPATAWPDGEPVAVTDGGELAARAKPDREEYPEPSLVDLRRAIEAALNDADSDHPWTHHRRGRYTAYRTHTEHDPDGKPGEKHVAIRVEECERDVIMDVSEAHAASVIGLLDHRLAGAEPRHQPRPEQFEFEEDQS